VIDAMSNVQSQQTSCPSSVSQYALMAALDGPQDCVAEMRTEFQARRDLVCDRLRKIPGITFPTPDGAFYVFFDVSAYFGKPVGGLTVTNSLDFCKACLEAAHVNLVPGSAFGAEGFVRMSYANSRAELEGGLAALAKWLGA
jgi:aspartate aminotransferase